MSGRVLSVGVAVLASVVGAAAYGQTPKAKKTSTMKDAIYSTRLTARSTIAAGEAQTERPIELRLTSRYALSPAVVRSLVRVAPHADNRTLRVVIDSENYYRSSDVQLDGEHAAQSHFFSWAALLPGAYEVTVTVLGPDGPRAAKTLPFDVLETSVGLTR